jgi:ABC-type branched-subunit amino acid transport system ATPase component
MSEDIILETRGLTKEFKGFLAVNEAALKVRRGHIHALIGPNGAGHLATVKRFTSKKPALSYRV